MQRKIELPNDRVETTGRIPIQTARGRRRTGAVAAAVILAAALMQPVAAQPVETTSELLVSPSPSFVGEPVTMLATVEAADGTDISGEVAFHRGPRLLARAKGIDGRSLLQHTPIASSDMETCALTAAGGVKCWGGQFGRIPRIVPGLESGNVSITRGRGHTCVLTQESTVFCRGNNLRGQLGNGVSGSSQVPQPILPGNDGRSLDGQIRVISAGYQHTCAVTHDGAAYCWGNGSEGRLGHVPDNHFQRFADRFRPHLVTGLETGVASIFAGQEHTCAVTDAGAALCWGFNAYGQLGTGSTRRNELQAQQVHGLSSGVRDMAAGHRSSCAVTMAGAVLCWGTNGSDLVLGIGDENRDTIRRTPTPVVGIESGAVSIHMPSTYVVIHGTNYGVRAINEDGSSWLWGSHYRYGRRMSTPRWVDTTGHVAFAQGAAHHCSIRDTGRVTCCGYNYGGQLGDGTHDWEACYRTVLGGAFAPKVGRMGAAFVTDALPRGRNVLQARFARTAPYAASRSERVVHRVERAETWIELEIDPSPSMQGEEVVLTASVGALRRAGPLEGQVEFRRRTSEGVEVLATVDVVDREAAELRLSGLEAGRNVFSAAYLGTPVHLPSRTPWQAHQVLPPERADTTTVLSAHPSPSPEGEAVQLRAEVTSPSGVPDGLVRFRLVTDDGPVVLAEVPTAGGVAEFETAALEAGWHVLTALFARTDTHEASSSTRLRHQVLPEPDRALLHTGRAGDPPAR